MVKDAAGGPIEGRHARVVQLRYRMALPVIERGTPIIWFHLGYAPSQGSPSFLDFKFPLNPSIVVVGALAALQSA